MSSAFYRSGRGIDADRIRGKSDYNRDCGFELNKGVTYMRNIVVTGFIAAPLLAFAVAMPSFAADPAPTSCKDGTTTTSTGKGTCSGHGGVQKAAKAAPAAASPAKTATPAPAAPAATGA